MFLLVTIVMVVVACAPQATEPPEPVPEEPAEAPAATEAPEAPEPTQPPEPAEAPEKTLTIAYKIQYSDHFDISVMVYADAPTFMIYDTLVSVDTEYGFQPGALATGWDVSDDGTLVTFYLKEGVTFHDGSAFNSAALKWWFEEMVKEGACCAYMYNAITEITTPDDYTIELSFEGPFPALFYYLSGAWGLIMGQEAYESLGPDDFASNPIGTGPFILEEWVYNERFVLTRNEDYNWGAEWTGHEGPANVDQIIYRIIPEESTRLIELEAGDTHILYEAPWREVATYEGDPDYQVIQVPDATIWFVGFNINAPIVGDLATRQAIGHAIDRDLIQETLYQGLGQASNTYLAQELGANVGVPELAPSYDLAEAADLLAEAGWAMGDDGVLVAESVEGVDAGTVFEVDYMTYQDDEARRLAEATQSMLAEIGVRANIVPLDKPTYDTALEAGDFTVILRRYTWDGLDILPWFHDSYYLPYPNYTGVNDPEIDQMFYDAEYARATWDERTEAFRESHIALIERWYPWAPIYQRPLLIFARSSVQDFYPIPLRGGTAETYLMVDLAE
jgi:peptide/nickel transport system substrate-binding protein